MRPCRQCRTPIENSVAACPQCNAVQIDAPKVNSETEPQPRHSFAKRVVADLFDLFSLSEPLGLIFIAAPLALGGAVGYLAAGEIGAVIGIIAGGAFIIGVMAWSEAGG